jgi:hypothetical protein
VQPGGAANEAIATGASAKASPLSVRDEAKPFILIAAVVVDPTHELAIPSRSMTRQQHPADSEHSRWAHRRERLGRLSAGANGSRSGEKAQRRGAGAPKARSPMKSERRETEKIEIATEDLRYQPRRR